MHATTPEALTRRAEAAEQTVEVLKNKVRQLYNGSGGDLVHLQLERQKRRRHAMELRTAELERYNAALEREVQARTQAIQNILDNVTFGFLIVDRELRIQEGFTRSCEHLFGAPFSAGDDLAALLHIQGTPQHIQMMLALDQVFEDLMDEEVSLAQLPTRFATDERVLRIEGRVVRREGGGVSGILLTISDQTDLEAAQRRERYHEALIRILSQRSAFERFVEDSRDSIEESRARLGDATFVRRAVHTIKGNAASYGLESVVEATHDAESQSRIGEEELTRIEAAFQSFLKAHARLLNISYNGLIQPTFEISAAHLQRLRGLVTERNDKELERWAAEVVMRPAAEVMGPTSAFVMKLAERLGKDVEFEAQGSGVEIDSERLRPVFSALPHLLRNALDHGIEHPWRRGDKPMRGRITLRVAQDEQAWLIAVADDGRGIDLARLSARALEIGLYTAEQLAAMSVEERIGLVFCDGLSSVAVSTEISGRGIGMSAVRAAVEQVQGSIFIETQQGRGTCVTLRIPREKESAQESAGQA